MLRVTTGRAKGTRLILSPGVRPMPSRMKQALFNMLGDRIENADVLDLFAGTGSLGIEAVSRGAGSAILVEKDRKLQKALLENTEKAGVNEECRIMCADAYRICDFLDPEEVSFAVVFLDPPYAQSEDERSRQELAKMLVCLEEKGIIGRDTAIVLHTRAAGTASECLPETLEIVDLRQYGTGTLMVCRLGKNTCKR